MRGLIDSNLIRVNITTHRHAGGKVLATDLRRLRFVHPNCAVKCMVQMSFLSSF